MNDSLAGSGAFERAEGWIDGRNIEEMEDDIVDVDYGTLFILQTVARKDKLFDSDDEQEEVQDLIDAHITYVEGVKNGDIEEGNSKMDSDEADTNDTRYYGGTESQDVWDSGMTVIDSFDSLAEHILGVSSLEEYVEEEIGITENKVIVPDEVRKICVAIQEECGGTSGSEWGALFKGEWTVEGFRVLPEYVIPEQNASRAHITYEEDLGEYRDKGYIVNIHSHPFSGENAGFSGTDDEHVNSQFDIALLYAGKAESIVNGVINFDLDSGDRVQLEPEIEVERVRDLPSVDVSNITLRQNRTKVKGSGSVQTNYSGYSKYYDAYSSYKQGSSDDESSNDYGY